VTSVQVRTSAKQPDRGSDLLLDWFGPATAKASFTVQYEPRFLAGLQPGPVARDLFRLGGAVFCADKKIERATTADAWTRSIEMQVPVSHVALWEAARPDLIRALGFLSGDNWTIEFTQDEPGGAADEQLIPPAFDGVCLFSGGLDSLSGAIDLLEEGQSLLLVGHHDSPLTDSKQTELSDLLVARYGSGRVLLRHLWLRPAPASSTQQRSLPTPIENSTRCRSFLFFAAGVAVADAVGPEVPLLIPENGFIGLNVPLTPARAGSLSTRTTHPLYMHWMGRLLQALGLEHPLVNPYRLLTKGELLERNAAPKFLRQVAPRSVSCSHPEAARWRDRPQGNCGYCYPCLIRRASLHRIGEDNPAEYAWDALTDPELLQRHVKSGRSLRALAASISRPERREEILHNGRIPNGEFTDFFAVYVRGRAELRQWLDAGAGPALRRRLATP
jgi:hypothetical protein